MYIYIYAYTCTCDMYIYIYVYVYMCIYTYMVPPQNLPFHRYCRKNKLTSLFSMAYYLIDSSLTIQEFVKNTCLISICELIKFVMNLAGGSRGH